MNERAGLPKGLRGFALVMPLIVLGSLLLIGPVEALWSKNLLIEGSATIKELDPTPTPTTGNPSCADLSSPEGIWEEFKLEGETLVAGTHTVPGVGTITRCPSDSSASASRGTGMSV